MVEKKLTSPPSFNFNNNTLMSKMNDKKKKHFENTIIKSFGTNKAFFAKNKKSNFDENDRSQITELWFENNYSDNKCMIALSNFSTKNDRITVIKICNNKITTIETGILNQVLDGLKENKSLLKLVYDEFRFVDLRDRKDRYLKRNGKSAGKARNAKRKDLEAAKQAQPVSNQHIHTTDNKKSRMTFNTCIFFVYFAFVSHRSTHTISRFFTFHNLLGISYLRKNGKGEVSHRPVQTPSGQNIGFYEDDLYFDFNSFDGAKETQTFDASKEEQRKKALAKTIFASLKDRLPISDDSLTLCFKYCLQFDRCLLNEFIPVLEETSAECSNSTTTTSPRNVAWFKQFVLKSNVLILSSYDKNCDGFDEYSNTNNDINNDGNIVENKMKMTKFINKMNYILYIPQSNERKDYTYSHLIRLGTYRFDKQKNDEVANNYQSAVRMQQIEMFVESTNYLTVSYFEEFEKTDDNDDAGSVDDSKSFIIN